MKGLDTNILVRYVVQDEPVQGEKVAQFIEEAVASGETFFINNVVLCELVWVLKSAYDYSKEEIADLLEKLLQISVFDFESKDEAWWALRAYRKSKVDFSDCLISRHNQSHGCSQTVSFDKGVKGIDGFVVL